MSSTTDQYRSRHGDYAYARLAARASMAGLESLAAELLSPTAVQPGTEPGPRPVRSTSPVSPVGPVIPARSTTPGAIPGRNIAGRALPVRDGTRPPTTR
ncbi:hypothetical protein V3N99_01410 [Dermatophilaceae bacterium Soc4.6]